MLKLPETFVMSSCPDQGLSLDNPNAMASLAHDDCYLNALLAPIYTLIYQTMSNPQNVSKTNPSHKQLFHAIAYDCSPKWRIVCT